MKKAFLVGSLFDHRETIIVSVAIVLGALLYLPIPVGSGGRVLSLSAFDIVMLGLFLWLLYRRRFGRSVVECAAMLTALVVGLYVSAFWLFGPELEGTGLIRETAKYLGFIFGVIVCGFTVRFTNVLDLSPLLAVLLGVLILVTWLLMVCAYFSVTHTAGFDEMHKYQLLINAYSNVAICLAIAALYCFRNRMTPRVWLGITLYEAGVLILTGLAGSISMSLTSGIVLALSLYAASRGSGDVGRFFRWALIFFLLLVFFASAFFFWVGAIGRLETVHLRGSIAVRLGLWMQALELVREHFPFGIGPGQFGSFHLTESELVYSLPREVQNWFGFDAEKNWSTRAFGSVPIRYFHNTFLALVVELGVVGFSLTVLLLILTWRSIKILTFPASACYVAYAIPTLMLNDGLGFRINYLILGIGISAWLSANSGIDAKGGHKLD